MDVRKIDIGMRSGWMRTYQGGLCDMCIVDFEEEFGAFLEGEDSENITTAEYVNVTKAVQVCSDHFAYYCDINYIIIEEVPIP